MEQLKRDMIPNEAISIGHPARDKAFRIRFCDKCSQYFEGECRAFEVPHSPVEFEHRNDGFGMECDSEYIKAHRYTKYGMKYRTPMGRFDK